MVMRMIRGAPSAALLALVTLGLIGCGGGPVNVLNQVKSRGVVRVGVKADAPPFGVKEGDDYYGFDVDIAKAVAGELGVEVDWVAVTSANRFKKVKSGEIDMAIASSTITRGREADVDFSIPYFQDGQGLLVLSGSEIGGYEDLAGKTVGGTAGSTSVKRIKQVQPDCKVAEFSTYAEALDALREKKVDAITSDMLILTGLRLKAKDSEAFELAGPRFSEEPYGIAVAENQSDWRDAINDALQRIMESGEYQKIFENRFGEKGRYHVEAYEILTYPR